MSKSISGKTPAESLLGSVSDAINSANYSWTTGAIQRAKCLSINHFSKSESHPELQIIAAQMNAYYSAIGYFKANGGLYHFIALWCLINAKKLADEYLSCLEEKSLSSWSDHESVGALQQCQASYWAWAKMKKILGLKVIKEMTLVVDLYHRIRLNKETGESLVALAAEKVYNFPSFRVDTDLYYMVRETIKKEIVRLQNIPERESWESQVLSRLLRATGKHEEAVEVALTAGLPDQVQKAKAGI